MTAEEAFRLKFQEVRRPAGLTQYQVADLLGWYHSRIQKIEAGSMSIPLGDAVTLADAFGMKLADMLGDGDTAPAALTGATWRAAEHAVRQRIAAQILAGDPA